jgi:hypothetical protein
LWKKRPFLLCFTAPFLHPDDVGRSK